MSSNYKEVVAKVVGQAMWQTGLHGVINIVESPTGKTNFKMVNGLMFERGLVSDAFIIENKVEQKIEFNNPLVLVAPTKIKTQDQISPLLEKVKALKRPLIVFSEDL